MSSTIRNRAIKTAQELGYPLWVTYRLSHARSEKEISRILATARREATKEDIRRLNYKFVPHPTGVITYCTTV